MKTLLRIVAFLSVVAALVVGGLVWTGRKDLLLGEESAVLIPPTPLPTATPLPTPTPVIKMAPLPVTMPMLDALLQLDQRFAQELKTRVPLTDEQIAQLKTLANEETGKLREDDSGESTTTTDAAGELATQKLTELVGAEKARLISDLTLERMRSGLENDLALAAPSPSPSSSETPLPMPSTTPVETSIPVTTPSPGVSPSPSPNTSTPAAYNIPFDTRIVVNAPAYRMDVFQNGQLLKSYKIGIGYPEFPLPDGVRKASSIIFNPTWTPPDEPWVEASKKVKVGQKVAAGDALNPLGVIKIPIGLPSLIHGGKQPAKLGGFASHGCVGMTNKQVQEFTKYLAQIGGTELAEEQITAYEKTPTQTKVVKLKQTVPVEFRYDTIVVSDGALHIYRDVYDRDTNTEENLRAVLEAHGVTMNDLTVKEKTEALKILDLMSAHPSGKATDANLTEAEKKAKKEKNIEAQKLTASVKGKKEIVIPIAALAGKGYPAPVDLNTGAPPAKPKTLPAKKKK
jgi:lipoprotein-anchoring transpeptidase ErfK/SrfK